MKKTILLLVLLSTFIFAGGDIEPMEPIIDTPIIEESSAFIPTGIAVLGGAMKIKGYPNDWKGFYGVELSFPCLVSDSVISQIQITNYDNNDLKVSQINANPHYVFNLSQSSFIGVGPSIGVARLEKGNETDTVFTYGVGVSVRTNITDSFFIGAEARYELSAETDLSGFKDDLTNAKVFAKLGYSF